MGWFEDILGGGLGGALPQSFGGGLDQSMLGGLVNGGGFAGKSPFAQMMGMGQQYTNPIGPNMDGSNMEGMVQPGQEAAFATSAGLLGNAFKPSAQTAAAQPLPQAQGLPQQQAPMGQQVQKPQSGLLSLYQFQRPTAAR